MVTSLLWAGWAVVLPHISEMALDSAQSVWPLLAQQSPEPLLQRLDPYRRSAVVMALLAIGLVGLLFVTSILLGGNWVRRLARHKPAGEAIRRKARGRSKAMRSGSGSNRSAGDVRSGPSVRDSDQDVAAGDTFRGGQTAKDAQRRR